MSLSGLMITNQTKFKDIQEFAYEYMQRMKNYANSYVLSKRIFVRPVKTLRIGVSANYGSNTDHLQYVTIIKEAAGNKYTLGKVDQQTRCSRIYIIP